VAITLDHTIVPAHDRKASARFFAGIFGLPFDESAGHFAPVRINQTLTLDFSDADQFDTHHYAFHVDDAAFDAILGRVRKAAIPYGSDPRHPENGRLNAWNGGRGFYFRDPNGHLLELMTRAQT
jgi:catechol 2,3-dioxygenase-like lactoylglutathione lyase family enzyme